jgi:hypothetical protein
MKVSTMRQVFFAVLLINFRNNYTWMKAPASYLIYLQKERLVVSKKERLAVKLVRYSSTRSCHSSSQGSNADISQTHNKFGSIFPTQLNFLTFFSAIL